MVSLTPGYSLSGAPAERWVFLQGPFRLGHPEFQWSCHPHETAESSAQLPGLLAALPSAQILSLLSLCLYNLETALRVKVP